MSGSREERGVLQTKYGIVVRLVGTTDTPPKLCGFSFNGGFGADGGFDPMKIGDDIGSLDGIWNSFPPADKTATMRFAIAVGDFAPSPIPPAVWGGDGGHNVNGRTPAGNYLISKPFLRQRVAAVMLSSMLEDVDFRLKATVSGFAGKRTVIGKTVDGSSIDFIAQTTVAFDGVSDLASIDSIELEYRPIEWVEFRKVSLRPGAKTDVQSSVSGQPPARSQTIALGQIAHISGDTTRPGDYSITEQMKTVYQLLDKAETLGHPTDIIRLVRNRIASATTILNDVSLESILPGSKSDVPLEAYDVITVTAPK